MRIGIVSGYFNPLHTGHLDYIEEAKAHCEYLYVIVNSDLQVKLKQSREFLDEASRVRIIDALRDVYKAVLSVDKDGTVVQTIKSIYEENYNDPFVSGFCFMNGGDRKAGNTPESDFCEKNQIRLIYNVGGVKTQSSSSLLEKTSINDGINWIAPAS